MKSAVADLFYIDLSIQRKQAHGILFNRQTANLLYVCIRRLIQLKNTKTRPWEKVFYAWLCNKCAILRESTGYPSNRGPKGRDCLGISDWLKQRTMNTLLSLSHDFWATY